MTLQQKEYGCENNTRDWYDAPALCRECTNGMPAHEDSENDLCAMHETEGFHDEANRARSAALRSALTISGADFALHIADWKICTAKAYQWQIKADAEFAHRRSLGYGSKGAI